LAVNFCQSLGSNIWASNWNFWGKIITSSALIMKSDPFDKNTKVGKKFRPQLFCLNPLYCINA
jgi:hypothetical protein